MNVSRRTLLSGGLLGAGVVGVVGYSEGLFDSYSSKVRVKNRRAISVTADLTLTDLDADRTVLDESVTLDPDEDFQERGVLSNQTNYRVAVETGDDSVEEEFETCCRGFQVHCYVEQDEIQVMRGHHD